MPTAALPVFPLALRFWTYLGFVSFGGPAGQIATLHDEVVVKRRWMSEERFTSGLAFCTFLPGPEAQQLATYIGWSLHGARGGLAAGILFFLPASILLLALSFIRAGWGTVPLVSAILYGLRPIVVAVIVDAVVRMAGKRLRSRAAAGLAAGAFLAALVFRAPFPWIVLGAGLLGLVLHSFRPLPYRGEPSAGSSWSGQLRRAGTVLATGLSLWVLPWAGLVWLGDAGRLLRHQYVFFTQAAFVTFGGAYAVLSYVTQSAVEQFRWLSRAEVIDGLALAETTPGPLIIVLQYIGFLAAWNDPQGLPRALSGTLGAMVTTWATFLPSMALVFLGAPYVERLNSLPRLAGALAAISAAVVGVIASLGLDYGLTVILPGGSAAGPDLTALLIIAVALVGLRRGVGLGFVLLGGALAGCLRWLLSS